MSEFTPDVLPPVATELRDLARVLKAAIGMVRGYWRAQGLSATHPYHQAARMIESYLEKRYRV